MMSEGKTLIVERKDIASIEMKKALNNNGFNKIEKAFTYDDALAKVKDFRPNLIIMDLDFEEERDGITLVKKIKEIENIPLLYLSTNSNIEKLEKTFETDPVAFITNPYNKKELDISIKFALHKMNKQKEKTIQENYISIGLNYYFDLINEELYYKSESIRLGPKERKLITLLVKANFSPVSTEAIEYELWPNTPPSESSLRTLIYRLKSKLGCKLIETSYFNGYKLIKQTA